MFRLLSYCSGLKAALIFQKELRLFPRREVPAFVYLMEVHELVIGSFGPASWRTINLAGEHRHRGSESH
jgi:hypothetical protein